MGQYSLNVYLFVKCILFGVAGFLIYVIVLCPLTTFSRSMFFTGRHEHMPITHVSVYASNPPTPNGRVAPYRTLRCFTRPPAHGGGAGGFHLPGTVSNPAAPSRTCPADYERSAVGPISWGRTATSWW